MSDSKIFREKVAKLEEAREQETAPREYQTCHGKDAIDQAVQPLLLEISILKDRVTKLEKKTKHAMERCHRQRAS